MNDLSIATKTIENATPVHPDAQEVTAVTHWTDSLFSFRLKRPQSLRFRSGEFVMIGLPGDNGKPILRAYSIASPSWDDELEFYSIKVPHGPLTSLLKPFLEVLQTIRRLLIRSEYFRGERELPGPDFHRGEQCTLARHTQQPLREQHQAFYSGKKELAFL